MADEKSPNSSGDGKAAEGGSKRRYFRQRRRKGKSGEKRTNEQAAPTAQAGGKEASPERKPNQRNNPGNPNNNTKKRRSRRRNGRDRQPQVETPSVVNQEPEPTYHEPSSVYVYTYIVRPAYRDSMSDYRPETSFLQSAHREGETVQIHEHGAAARGDQRSTRFAVQPAAETQSVVGRYLRR